MGRRDELGATLEEGERKARFAGEWLSTCVLRGEPAAGTTAEGPCVFEFPEATLVPDALLRLVDVYRAIGYREEIAETCEHLRRYHPRARGLAERCPASPGAT